MMMYGRGSRRLPVDQGMALDRVSVPKPALGKHANTPIDLREELGCIE